MYGYVRPFVPELKVAQYEQYRALYCGLCRAMGSVTGQLSRFTLSYDLTFFAAVRMILEGVTPEFEPFRCPAHLAQKRLYVKLNPALEFTAAASAALAGAKTADDLADERGFYRVKPVLRRPLTAYMNARAAKHLPPDTDEEINRRLAWLGELEAANSPSLDETAAAFGEVLAYCFALGLDPDAAELARTFGMGVGRFVYLCDAADDLPADVKRGRYNPLYIGWGGLALEEGKLSPMVKDSLTVSAPIALESVGEAAERLDPGHILTPIVKNIVYLGLPASLRRVLNGEGKERGKEMQV